MYCQLTCVSFSFRVTVLYEISFLNRRFVHGELQYLVRWEGFTSEDDTWEPVEHLTKCASRIEAYEQSLQREEARKDAAQSSKARDKRNKRNPEAEDAIGAKRIKVSQ